jgi:hypothetical protein
MERFKSTPSRSIGFSHFLPLYRLGRPSYGAKPRRGGETGGATPPLFEGGRMPNQSSHRRASARGSQSHRHAAHAAKDHHRHIPLERCTRCGVTLQPAEAAFLWKSSIVCGECYTRRQAARVAAALIAPQMSAIDDDPDPRCSWWRWTCNLLCRPITLGTLFRRTRSRRHRHAEAITPMIACLHRVAHRT